MARQGLKARIRSNLHHRCQDNIGIRCNGNTHRLSFNWGQALSVKGLIELWVSDECLLNRRNDPIIDGRLT